MAAASEGFAIIFFSCMLGLCVSLVCWLADKLSVDSNVRRRCVERMQEDSLL